MWLPGFERWEITGRPGVPYDEYDDPKGMVHTTQGTSIEGAVSAYQAYPPQLIVDPWRKRKVQHISLANAGYALWNEDVDDSRCVQIEIVGYAEDTPSWPDEVYRWLGEELARPLHEHFGIPYVEVWKGFKSPADVDYILASASSPLRLTQWEIDHFSGWLAHQHSPGDNHWDAGGFKCGLMLAYAQGNTQEEDEMPLLVKGNKSSEVFVVSSTADGYWKRHIGSSELNVLKACGAELKVLNQWDVDQIPAAMSTGQSPTGQAVADYKIPDGKGGYAELHKVLDTVNRNTTPEA